MDVWSPPRASFFLAVLAGQSFLMIAWMMVIGPATARKKTLRLNESKGPDGRMDAAGFCADCSVCSASHRAGFQLHTIYCTDARRISHVPHKMDTRLGIT